jgi:hypothetical protein
LRSAGYQTAIDADVTNWRVEMQAVDGKCTSSFTKRTGTCI